MRKLELVAAVIAGDNVTGEQWSRMVASLEGQVDAVALCWNGARKEPPSWMRQSALPVAWSRVPWNDDFSEQRNASFSIASAAAPGGWILWIDTDDELRGSLKRTIDSLDPYTSAVMLRYDYAVEEDGHVTVVQWRERLMRSGVSWAWEYRVHEVCHAPVGTQFAKRDIAYVTHHRTERDAEAVRRRNRALVDRMVEEHPEIPLFRFYLGQELLAEGQTNKDPDALQRAAVEYLAYVAAEPWADNAYVANHHVADIYRDLGRLEDAMERELQGMKLRPTWPDSFNGLAHTCLLMGEPAHAQEWATLSLNLAEPPDTTQAFEPMELDYTPRMLRSVARERLGDLAGAIDDLEVSMQVWQPDENVRRLRDLRRAAGHIPVDLEGARKDRRGLRPSQSIAFFTKPLFEPWHPSTAAEGGIGGAETCVMRLAKRFAAADWRVAVYGTPGVHEGVDEDGIEWWKSSDFVAAEPFTVLVSSRAPEIFDSVPEAKRTVLWVHDVNLADLWRETAHGDRRARVDVTVALSEWHAEHLRVLYGADTFRQLAVVPNGLDVERFEREPQATEAPRFAWSSSPDRGLDTLLEMWPEIRRRWPDATLDVFYGWESIESIIAAAGPESLISRKLFGFRQRVEALVEECGAEQGGIRWHGRVPQDRLAEHLYKASVWPYPTQFLETHCITAYEMQAAGVIPVTSKLGALPEAVRCPDLLVDGWPDNRDYRERWMRVLDHVMNLERPDRQRLVEANRKHALGWSWEDSFDAWTEMLQLEPARKLVAVS